MRVFALLFVILGVAIAGGAVYLLNKHLEQQNAMVAGEPSGTEMVDVIVATKRLTYGHRIGPNTLTGTMHFAEWPANAVPEGAFTDAGELAPPGEEPRVVLRTIEPGELILRSKISGFGESARLATRVSGGMRAFTIPINAVSAVAGLIAPGDRVDILLTRNIHRELTTSVILQNVLVIAVDQTSNTESARAGVGSTATVEVTPTDANKLALAQQVGGLSLTLRGIDTPDAEEEIGPTQVKDLPSPVQPEAAPAPVVEQTPQVRVRKGGQVETITVD
ncbi:MAG: Flp pilus assembly protein CpaB [Pseudomonadota bacterium]